MERAGPPSATPQLINAHQLGLKRHGYDGRQDLGDRLVVALWSEVTRFNIGAQVHWPQNEARPSAKPRDKTLDLR